MSQYPKALYKFGGLELVDGEPFTTALAHDAEHEESLSTEGFYASAGAAKKAAGIAEQEVSIQSAAADEPVTPVRTATDDGLDPVEPVADEAAPPTRAELEQKATELKIKFDGRTSDEKLAAKIADALK